MLAVLDVVVLAIVTVPFDRTFAVSRVLFDEVYANDTLSLTKYPVVLANIIPLAEYPDVAALATTNAALA
jgi:hypothetical protein